MKTKASLRTETEAELGVEFARYSRSGILWRRVRRGSLGGLWRLLLVLNGWGKRAFDIFASLAGLAVLAPLLASIALVKIVKRQRLFAVDVRNGRWGVPFHLIEFDLTGRFGLLLCRFGIQRLPRLINVVRGDMSLIGPPASRPNELGMRQRALQKRSSVRPGLVSLWWLRKRANIDFTSELEMDLEYIDRQTVRGDLGIALRTLPAILYGSGSTFAPERVDVLGVPMLNLTMDEALEYILDAARSSAPKQLCFVNTDCVNKAQNSPQYAARLRAADAVLADGIGIRIAGKILHQEIRQNVNGTDLFPLLCGRIEGSDLGLFLLGAKPGVVESVRDWVTRNYPRARVSGVHHGYFSTEEQEDVLREIRQSGAQILLVAFGAPRQDLWIGEHLAETGVGIAMGVGGLFDFYSGRIPRAPQWMRELSLEWAFRLWQEPSRMWKRYLLGNIIFLSRVLWSMLNRRNAHASQTEM